MNGISVILPNYNGQELLKKYLPYLMKATANIDLPFEIIVVDDASIDHSVEMLKKEFPQVKIVLQDRNSGFSISCNKGARISIYDKLLFLNTDMRVEEDFLEHLLDALTEDAFAVSGAIIEGKDGKKFNTGLNYAYIYEPDTVMVTEVLKLDLDNKLAMEKRAILWASGGLMLCWKDKFQELGGFDVIYSPFYWEDADLSYRAWKRGWKVYYEPRCVVHHEHQGTIGRMFSKKFVGLICERNQLIFMWKNISDKDLLQKFALKFFTRLLIPNPKRQYAALMALKRLPDVLKFRKSSFGKNEIGDKELLDKFLYLQGYQGYKEES